MDLTQTQHGFFEEIRTEAPWREVFAFHSGWSLDSSDPLDASLSTTVEHGFQGLLGSETACSYFGGFHLLQDMNSSYNRKGTTQFPTQEDREGGNPNTLMGDDTSELGFVGVGEDHIPQVINGGCQLQLQLEPDSKVTAFKMGFCSEKEMRAKKMEGQPSKNLMAERRRRKRLNDRLSMLRSIVPKISKMDRTSIIGDTIDYVKELKESISKLQQELEPEEGTDPNPYTPWMIANATEIMPNEAPFKNSQKFSVEKRELDTRISIFCAPRPGLLLSTVTTLEALGLEIKQCVISSFHDFSVQASCSESEVSEQSDEDIKQALFRISGYGGRCP